MKSRFVPGEPWFRMKHAKGPINAITQIRLLDKNDRYAYFRLEPLTGKQHQLRLHLSLLGCQILNDTTWKVMGISKPEFPTPNREREILLGLERHLQAIEPVELSLHREHH